MNKRQQISLREVIGQTKWRGERYVSTRCATCGNPLSVMVECWQEYVEKDRYCSDRCEQIAIQKIADSLGCVAEYPVDLIQARVNAEEIKDELAVMAMLEAGAALGLNPDADIDWNQSGEKTDAAYMQASEARYKLPPSKYGVSTMQEFAEKRDRQFWEYYNKRGR